MHDVDDEELVVTESEPELEALADAMPPDAESVGPHLPELPLLASAMDGVVSPATAIALGKLGALGVPNLERLWTLYAPRDAHLARTRPSEAAVATRRAQTHPPQHGPRAWGLRRGQAHNAGGARSGGRAPGATRARGRTAPSRRCARRCGLGRCGASRRFGLGWRAASRLTRSRAV